MPELPEVETTARGVKARLLGLCLMRVEQRRADLRGLIPTKLAAALEGQKLIGVDRRAKYMLLRFENGQTLLVHLGMSGRLTITAADPGARGKHDHLLFHFSDGAVLAFNDARRFGRVELFPTAAQDAQPLLAALGPEPLEDSFTGAVLRKALGKSTAPLKVALLDQTRIAGIGNIYACEALFYAKLSPLRAAGSLSAPEAGRLAKAIQKVLRAAVKAGGSSLRDYVQISGELGYFQTQFAVYDHAGQPCPNCKSRKEIKRITQAGRSTFYCDNCQK